MAELRDRYLQHGFDENGNDPNSKLMEKLVKVLSENNRLAKLQLDFDKEQLRKNTAQGARKMARGAVEGVGGAVIGAAKTVGGVVGEGAKNLTSPQMVKDMLAVTGPLGYALSRLVPTISSVTGWGTDKKKSKSELTTEEAKKSQTDQDKRDREKAIKTFESYPTMIRLKAWLDYQAKTVKDEQGNRELLKMQLKYYANAKAREKEQKEANKKQDTWLSKLALAGDMVVKNQKLIVGLATLGVVGVLGLVAWIKSHPWKVDLKQKLQDLGGKITEPITDRINQNTAFSENIQGVNQYTKAQGLKLTSGFGMRTHDPVTGKKLSQPRPHFGTDIGHEQGSKTISGDPVISLTDGVAKAYVSYPSGDVKYDPSNIDHKQPNPPGCFGYGKYVLVYCTDAWKKRLGFESKKQVIIRYGHLSQITVKDGEQVKSGITQIGNIGHSGRSAEGANIDDHLHLSVLVDGKLVQEGLPTLYGDYTPDGGKTYTSVDPSAIKTWLDKSGQDSDLLSAYKSMSYPGANIVTTPNSEGESIESIAQEVKSGLIADDKRFLESFGISPEEAKKKHPKLYKAYQNYVNRYYTDTALNEAAYRASHGGKGYITTRDKATIGMQANNTTLDNSKLAPLEVINDPEMYRGSGNTQPLPTPPQNLISFETTTSALSIESSAQQGYSIGGIIA